MNSRDLPLIRISDLDSSGTGIIDDLLNSLTEWRSVQDIVRLSIKALADTAKSQSNSIKELQYLQTEFALKSEISSSLAMKANLSDLSRTISETRASLDSKVSYEEVRAFNDDKVTRSDLIHLLQGKVSLEEFKAAIDFKVDVKEMQNEIRGLRNILEDFKSQTIKEIEQCASHRDVQIINRTLDTKANVNDVNAALNDKATKTSVANALHKKANKVDVEEMIADKANLSLFNGLSAALESKVSVNSFNILASEVEKKADSAHIEKILSYELSRKALKSDLEDLFESINSLKKEFEIKIQQQAITFGNYITDVKSENEMNKLTVSKALEKKAEYRDLEKLSEILLRKSDNEEISYLASSLKSDHQALAQSHQNALKQEIKKIENYFSESLSQVNKKHQALEEEQTNIKEILKTTSDKYKLELDECFKFFEKSKHEETKSIHYDLEKLQRELEQNKSKTDDLSSKKITNDLKSFKEELELKYEQLNSKFQEIVETTKEALQKHEKEVFTISGTVKSRSEDLSHVQSFLEDFKTNTIKRKDWEHQVYSLQEELEKLGKEILLKANIKDICTLLDIKANIDDVNHALEDLHLELDNKISVEELAEKLREQSCINEALCAENCIGRWLWKSGEIKNGAIPWEVQSINTCPENFIWEKDKSNVLAISPGLYHISFGVFARKKATLQLLINGEIVISEGSTQGKVLGKHSSGNLVGCTCSDFISIPARARISIAYTGDPSEGFLGLKKL
jgi:hypothetical protein